MVTIKKTPFIFLIAALIIAISQSTLSNNQWTAEECRSCHDNYKGLSLKASNSDLHHYLTGKKIRFFGATIPNAKTNTNDLYDCMTCHPIDNATTGYLELRTERDCLKCHKQGTQISDRHHYAVNANTGYSCGSCHFRLSKPLY